MIESHAWESLVFKWDVENFTAKALAGRHIDSSTFPIAGREMRALVALKLVPVSASEPLHTCMGWQVCS